MALHMADKAHTPCSNSWCGMLVKLTLLASCPSFPENKTEARLQDRSILWSLIDFNQMNGEVDMVLDL
jgi:hypothetical protein